MSDYRWLYIPVEVKHREFHSKVLLATLAVQRGYKVLLGKDTMIRRLAPALPPGIIFDKSLGLARHGKPQRFKRLGHKVVVLDEESTGYYGSPEQFLSVRLSNETLEACERWYCLSDKLRHHAAEMFPEHADKFKTKGLLRTDVWRPQLHGYYETERKRLAERHGPFILFNSNFGGIIHARGEAFVAKQIRGQKKAYSEVETRMQKIIEQGKPNLDAFVELLPKLQNWFPDHRVVIRPHPSETVSYWEQKFSNERGVFVSNEGVATPWILASDFLLHHGCTTGIEAEIMGKHHVMFAPFPDEHHETEVMKAFAPITRDEASLRRHIERHIDQPHSPVSPEAQSAYFASLRGELACNLVLDDLDELAFSSRALPERLPLSVRARIWLADNKGRTAREKSYIKQKWPGTSLKEIRSLVAISVEALDAKKMPVVTNPIEDIFQIAQR